MQKNSQEVNKKLIKNLIKIVLHNMYLAKAHKYSTLCIHAIISRFPNRILFQ
jgi:hypothetical protein